jgi:hypothetical protein
MCSEPAVHNLAPEAMITDNDNKPRINKNIYYFIGSEHKLRLHNYVIIDITDNDHKQA